MVESGLKLVVWGQEGVGKTTFASLFPEPWFIDTERSTRWIPELKARQFQPYPKTWADVINHLKMFKQQRCGKTLVIDTADWMEAMLIKDLCNRKGWDSLGGNNDFGTSYNVLDKEFREFLDELNDISDMGIHIIMNCHMQVRTFTTPDQIGSWDRYELKMQKKTSGALKEWADCILFLKFKDVVIAADKKGEKFKAQGGTLRVINSVRTATWDAKNRFGLPEEMIFENKQLPKEIVAILQELTGSPVTQAAPMPTPTPQPSIRPQSFEPKNPFSAPATQQTAAQQPDPAPQTVKDESWREVVNPKLVELMDGSMITKSDIEEAVNMKGFFSPPLTIEQYPADFVEQMLIKNWESFMDFMLKNGVGVTF